MEVITLAGLLGLGVVASKFGKKQKAINASDIDTPSVSQSAGKPYYEATPPKMVSQPIYPSGPIPIQEGFVPAFRGMNSDALTNTPKGSSAVGFAPELDLMYQTPNGQTYPSEPKQGPYGNAFGYATQKPPLAPLSSPDPQPAPQPIDSNIPMVEYRSDNMEMDPVYVKGDYVMSSLSGKKVSTKDFKHNNMQPFFGGRMKQNISAEANKSRLDAFTGTGSVDIKKREVENMFESSRAPYGNPFGMEDNSDFYQSRIVDSRNRNGEKPFEQVHVGAGVGERNGFLGKGGFQQLEVNEIMRPRTTDEIRVATNPKVSYEAVTVPGKHFIGTSPQDAGEVRKYRPDTFYIDETGERFFTTTGEIIKETARPTQILNYTTRPETSTDYTGPAQSTDLKESYVVGSYRTPMTQQYGGAGYRNADMQGYYTTDVDTDQADYGKSSYEIRPNERFSTAERTMGLNLAPADTGLVTTHYTDDARPTRRGETVGNLRTANVATLYADTAPAITVWDPQDVARTTVKESTIYLDRMGIAASASAPNRLKVYDPDDIARPTQKAQLSNRSWTGPSISQHKAGMDEQFAYNMRLNPNKEQSLRSRKPVAGNGNIAIFQGEIHQKTNKLNTDYINDRVPAINRAVEITSGVGDIGRPEFRVPLKLDVSLERNTYDSISSVDNNPLMQSLKKNAEKDYEALAAAKEMYGY
jgi:hypothetical protein